MKKDNDDVSLGIPHASGGDPYTKPLLYGSYEYSPRKWG